MLKIKDLYKKHKNNVIKDINIDKGSSISIECNNDISDLLIDLILGRDIPAKAEIYREDIKNLDYVRSNIASIGIVQRKDAFYDRMTIGEYMKFFAELLCIKLDYKEVMLKLALLDLGNKKIKNLSYSQKRRLSFGREILKQAKFLIFHEPILNMDRDGAKVIMENIEELKAKDTAILITSVVFKDTLMLSEKAYRLNDEGLIELDNGLEEAKNEREEVLDKKPVYKIEKNSCQIR